MLRYHYFRYGNKGWGMRESEREREIKREREREGEACLLATQQVGVHTYKVHTTKYTGYFKLVV